MFKYLKGLLVAALIAVPSLAEAQDYVKLWPNGAAGSLTATSQAVTITNAREMGTIGIQVTGTFMATLTPQCTIDGTNWATLRVTPTDDTTAVTSLTGAGVWTGSIAGCKQVRIVDSLHNSGTAVITLNTIQGGGGGAAGSTFTGDITGDVTVGAQPADDPHFVRCSNSVTASPCLVTGSGTAGTAATGVATVQGIVGMTPILATVSDGAGALNTIVDSGTITAVTSITNAVTVTDGSGALNIICDSGCGSGNTQYAEDAAHASGNTGTLALVVRNDAGTALAADGDNIPLMVNSAGALFVATGTVTVTDGSGALNTIVDSGTITSITNPVTVGTVTTITNPVTITDGAGAVNVICDSGCAGGVQYAEDASHNSGETGTLALVVRNDAGTALASNGDNIPLMVNSSGALYTAVSGTLTAVTAITNAVTVTDGAGSLNVICDSGCSGGTQYAEDTVHASGNTGTLALVVRNDAGTALAGDGDNIPLMVNGSGHLYVAGTVTVTDGAGSLNVICDSGCSGGTQYAEDAAHASGNTGTLALVVRNDAGTALAADGDNIPLMVNSAGSLFTTVTGTVTVAAHAVTNAGTFATQVDGAALTSLQLLDDSIFAEDAAHVTADKGVQMLAIRQDTATTGLGADGDYAPLRMDANGRLQVVIGAATTLATSNAGTFAVQESGAALTALQLIDNLVSVEDAVAGSAFSGIGMLAVRQDSQTALAADGDFIPPTIDAVGGLRVSIVAGGGTGGTALADGATFTANTTSITPIGGFFDDASSTACVENDACVARVTENRALHVNLRSGTGTEIVPATDQAEDGAESNGVTGPVSINVRRDVAASSASTTGDYATFNTDSSGLLWTRWLDPCSGVAKTVIPVNISTATTTELTPSLAGASTYYYVCAINLVTGGAQNIALVDDDSDGCGSVTSGMAGGTTAAAGWNFPANSGIALGTGASTVMKTNGTNRVICAVTSAAQQISGTIVVVAAP